MHAAVYGQPLQYTGRRRTDRQTDRQTELMICDVQSIHKYYYYYYYYYYNY